jgi:hypothetical protein
LLPRVNEASPDAERPPHQVEPQGPGGRPNLIQTGYELNAVGEAVDRRSIFVQVGGLQPANPAITSRFVGARRGSGGAIGGVVNQAAALRP